MDFIGLPLHPFAVHAAVVLVPVSLVAAVVVSFWGAARRRYGMLTLVTTVVAAGAAGLARLSGDALLKTRQSVSPILEGHESWGEAVIYPVLAAVIGLGLVLLSDWLRNRDPESGTEGYSNPRAKLAWLLGGTITVIAAASGLVLATLAGHSGATSVWS